MVIKMKLLLILILLISGCQSDVDATKTNKFTLTNNGIIFINMPVDVSAELKGSE